MLFLSKLEILGKIHSKFKGLELGLVFQKGPGSTDMLLEASTIIPGPKKPVVHYQNFLQFAYRRNKATEDTTASLLHPPEKKGIHKWQWPFGIQHQLPFKTLF